MNYFSSIYLVIRSKEEESALKSNLEEEDKAVQVLILQNEEISKKIKNSNDQLTELNKKKENLTQLQSK